MDGAAAGGTRPADGLLAEDAAMEGEEGGDCAARLASQPCVPSVRRQTILRSVLKVVVKRAVPSYELPWQPQAQRTGSGSAFVIDVQRRYIITNSHVVGDHLTIHVRRPGNPKKWKAALLCEGKACDLALLTVEEEAFWNGLQQVELRGVPELQQQVTVAGYPIGGDSLSITQGIVSRVSMSPYGPGGAALIKVQIDAAINFGNSGGPAFSDLAAGVAVGISYSRYRSADSIGYIIPECVVTHFLESYARDGFFRGLCTLGFVIQRLENPCLRAHLDLGSDVSGVLVREVSGVSPAAGALRLNDVITHVNGAPIADDATITFRHDERISMAHAVRGSHIGEAVELAIVREGQRMSAQYCLGPNLLKVPGLHGVDCWPSYFVYGGLVFQPLSQRLLQDHFGKHYRSRAPPLLLAYMSDFQEALDASIVVLSQVLAADLTFGYTSAFGALLSVNGTPVKNIYHLADLCDASASPSMCFDIETGDCVVLSRAAVAEASDAILAAHRIPADRSRDVVDRSTLPKQCYGALPGVQQCGH